MKIIHLTDTHIIGNKDSSFAIKTDYRFEMALESIKKNHSDASFVVITGDLASNGKLESYMKLKKLMDDFTIPIFLVLGNHDKKKVFNKVFDLCEDDEFVQYVKKFEDNVFLFLDTVVPKYEYGKLCKKRLIWLEEQLKKFKNRNVYFFMHHFPLNSQLPWMEENACFTNKKDFWDIVLKYSNVKHIFTGHLHRIVNANFRGVGVSCTRSTSFQVAYTPNDEDDYITYKENPTYCIVSIDEESIVIHNHEFMNMELIYIPHKH